MSTLPSLSNLNSLNLSSNRLTGEIPQDFTRQILILFLFGENAGLCAPRDATFQDWLQAIFDIDGPTCPPPKSVDRDALVAFYEATDGPRWHDNTNWLSDRHVEEWHGVTTDDDGRVVDITLDENRLTGEIPAQLGSLSELTEASPQHQPVDRGDTV